MSLDRRNLVNHIPKGLENLIEDMTREVSKNNGEMHLSVVFYDPWSTRFLIVHLGPQKAARK